MHATIITEMCPVVELLISILLVKIVHPTDG